MNGASGFREVLLLPPDHPQIGCYTSNGIDSGMVPSTISLLQVSGTFPSSRSDRSLRSYQRKGGQRCNVHSKSELGSQIVDDRNETT
jgi:hypothetical protein